MGRNKPSLLAKIYGMFEVKLLNKEVCYYIVMENLLMNMNPNVDIYDLKGSQCNRFLKKAGGALLDTNFLIDRNSEPILVEKVKKIDNFTLG